MTAVKPWEAPMNRNSRTKSLLPLLALAALTAAVPALAEGLVTEPAGSTSWLLERQGLEDLALSGTLQAGQGEIGGGAAEPYQMRKRDAVDRPGPGAGLTILASAVLPGAGEALMGHKRGYFMMAADIFAWTRVSKYHSDGKDYTDDYYAFADEHYSDELLVEGYDAASTDPERSGEGALYFPDVESITGPEDLDNLPLYVTVEEDRREYYENLGKWDQFIFGWDDYLRPSYWGPLSYDYEPTETISDLRTPWVSKNREIYRSMRADANNAYKNRDRWLYVNIGLRVFSVMQVAYLNGLLGGGDDQIKVAGHTVEIISQPQGLNRGTLGASISF
jgi:hypothetical protein